MDTAKKQTLILENKKKLTLDGVCDVESFNDDFLELNTCHGPLCVEGKALKIEELIQDGGKILITGEVTGIFYKVEKEEKRFFGKIFK